MPYRCSSSREVLVIRGGTILSIKDPHGELRTKKQGHLPRHIQNSVSAMLLRSKIGFGRILAQTAKFKLYRLPSGPFSKGKKFHKDSSSSAGAGGLPSEPPSRIHISKSGFANPPKTLAPRHLHPDELEGRALTQV